MERCTEMGMNRIRVSNVEASAAGLGLRAIWPYSGTRIAGQVAA
jgi:hypothetical protein